MDMVLPIVKYPAAILRKRVKKIENIDERYRTLLDDMVDTMRDLKGIGLAAPQVGLDIRLAVIDAGEGLLKVINPSIIEKEGTDTMDEGCLSIPSVIVKIKRAKTITLEYADESGKINKQSFTGLTAKAIQHEIDHLNGRLVLDYLPWYKRIFVRFKKR